MVKSNLFVYQIKGNMLTITSRESLFGKIRDNIDIMRKFRTIYFYIIREWENILQDKVKIN